MDDSHAPTSVLDSLGSLTLSLPSLCTDQEGENLFWLGAVSVLRFDVQPESQVYLLEAGSQDR